MLDDKITKVALGKVPEGKQTMATNKSNARVGGKIGSSLLGNEAIGKSNRTAVKNAQQSMPTKTSFKQP